MNNVRHNRIPIFSYLSHSILSYVSIGYEVYVNRKSSNRKCFISQNQKPNRSTYYLTRRFYFNYTLGKTPRLASILLMESRIQRRRRRRRSRNNSARWVYTTSKPKHELKSMWIFSFGWPVYKRTDMQWIN